MVTEANADIVVDPSAGNTLKEAVNSASDDDTIFLKGGTDSDSIPLMIDKNLEITVAEGATFKLDGSNYSPSDPHAWDAPAVRIHDTEGFVMDGTPGRIVIEGPEAMGLRVLRSNDFELKGITATGCALSGIDLTDNANNGLIEWVYSYGNDGRPINEPGNADGFHIVAGSQDSSDYPSNNTFRYCLAHHNSDDGFDTFRGQNNTFENCIAYRNGYYLDGGESPAPGAGFKLAYDRENKYEPNGRNAPKRNSVINCLSWGHGGAGILLGDERNNEGHLVENYTGWDNGLKMTQGQDNADIGDWNADSLVIRNSLVTKIDINGEGGQRTNNIVKPVSEWQMDTSVEGDYSPQNPGSFAIPDSGSDIASQDVGAALTGDSWVENVLLQRGTSGEVTTSSRVTAIEPNQHPNLYVNQQEIEKLRENVVNNREPQKAADAYFNHVQGTSPVSKPGNMDELDWADNYREGARAARENMKACFSYLLEPTDAKAEEIRSALLSWAEHEEVAAWTRDGQNSGWVQISLAFMYDAIYNSGVLSDSDKQQLDSWFAWSAEQLIEPNDWWSDLPSNSDKTHTINKEGSRRQEYDNWWTIRVSCGLVCAMVSHNQSLVDRGFNSDVPSDYYLSDISEYAPDTRDLHNLIAGSVYPSGYNYDGYKRNYGFDAPNESYNDAGEPQAGNGQHYHFYSMFPMIFAAEAAIHNGEDAFAYGDNAILRTFKKGSSWAESAHRNNGGNEDWRQAYWYVYRRHSNDSDIQEMTDQTQAGYDWFRIGDKTAPIWGALGDLGNESQAALGESSGENSSQTDSDSSEEVQNDTTADSFSAQGGRRITSGEAGDADSAIFGNIVTGVVTESKSDVFHIDGQLTEFQAEEGVTIIYEGEEYTPEELQEELPECDIRIFSTGETSDSSGTVSDSTSESTNVSFSTGGSTCQWEAPEGNQRYVSPDGGGDGTESNPWSVDQANANAQAGDVVNFLPGEYSQTISPENSGETGNPIIFRSQEFHGAKMTEYGVSIQNKSDIVIEGFNFDRENNSGQIWIQVSDGSERIVIKDNIMQRHVGNRNPCYIADSENIRFEGNLVRETTKGDMIALDNCDKLVVEGNDLSRAGHAPLNSDSTRSQNMVLRDNVMHAAVGRNCGWWRDVNVLNEGNAYVNSFDGPGSADSTSKIHGNNLIFRFNQISDNYGTGVKTTHYGDLDELIHARFYNNVFDSNEDAYNPKESTPEIAYGGFAMWGYGQEGKVRDVKLENNVFSRNNDSEIYIDRMPENELVYNNNTFWNDDRNSFIRHNGRKTVSEAESNIPQVYSDNSEEEPGFANLNTRDYYPSDNSPLRESGNYLTRTSSSGSGTQVPVEDTYYFYDGFGIYGEKGDIVQIGDSRARVTNVDHDNGVIEIDSDLQWGSDNPVGLPWSGNRPDKGIFETGNGRKSVRVIKDNHQATVGDEIKFRAQLNGGAEIDSVRWYLGNGEIVCGDGSGVSVTYQKAYDYGVRAKVIDSDGEINWGVDYVMISDGQIDVTSLEFNKSECDRVLCSKPGYEGDGRAGGYHCS